jgi:replicative DNA helicase
MSFQLGLKALKRLVTEEDALAFNKAKLTKKLFHADEVGVFEWVDNHLSSYQKLPVLETLCGQFPELKAVQCPEPHKYYLDKITARFAYEKIDEANVSSQQLLKDDKEAVDEAALVLSSALAEITEQRYRNKIVNFKTEGPKMVLQAYHNLATSKNPPAIFDWPTLDKQTGGLMPGDLISFVGRPASGKTFKILRTAIANWKKRQKDVMIVSAEMDTLSISQRIAAMFAHTNLTQLKIGGYGSNTFKLFTGSMVKVKEEPANLYVVDANLAVDVESIYALAAQLGVKLMMIDGAYLLRHRNARLDRYTRVADNVELMKRFTSDLEMPTVASWQFNREVMKKDKKKGQKVGVEDIGYSDAIGQISSIVLGLMQEEGVETMISRLVEVLKGRGGETGQFRINWDFTTMNFDEVIEGEAKAEGALEYL